MPPLESVWAIILAAGSGSRAGSTKQLLPLNGKPLLQHVLGHASASVVDGIVLVLGHDADQVVAVIETGAAHVVVNAAYATGQASSLIAGIEALPDEAKAAVVLLGDQPGITSAIIDTMIRAWREGNAPIVIPVWSGERGNPVVFAQSIFPEIRTLNGDTGARAIFKAHEGDIAVVEFDQPMPPDVDTPEDYARLIAN